MRMDSFPSMLVNTFLHQDNQNIPTQFIWPKEDLSPAGEELNEPLIDLSGFLKGDAEATKVAAELIRVACETHGFFQVYNHGVDESLVRAANDEMDSLFMLPMEKKKSLWKKPGKLGGYSSAHSERYTSSLPWKETFTVLHRFGRGNVTEELGVLHYFKSVVGEEFEQMGLVYQKYCEAMEKLSLAIFELLGISLGVEKEHYKNFFEDGGAILRCNYYPACDQPELTLGTGPHCDPTSLTILHQDQVGGLQVFSNNKWKSLRPRPGALVINVGDMLMALTNGIYKSCLHRAVVNKKSQRKSLAYFVNPKEDKVVKPPDGLVQSSDAARKYPDFKWADMMEFTQYHYRANHSTLQSFCQHWHASSSAYW